MITAAFHTSPRDDLHVYLQKFSRTFDPSQEGLSMCTHNSSRANRPGWRISDLLSCFSSRPGRRRAGGPLRLRRFERRKRSHRLANAPAVGHHGAERRCPGDDPRQRGDRRRGPGLGHRHLRRRFRRADQFRRNAHQYGDARRRRHREHQLLLQHRGRVAVRGGQRVHQRELDLRRKDRAAQRLERRAGRRRHHAASGRRRSGGGGTTPPPGGGGGTPPPPTGTPPGPATNIAVTASGPFVVGLKGSGIQERGSISYLVTDSLGIPVPGITVNFALQAPTLGITLLKTSGVSDLNGVVTEAYTSGSEVGVTTITATAATTGATVPQTVAVRGAKPSANGFYFHCANASLPVYTTVLEYETTTCTVRLADRLGNRVGIPTVVNFATEAGAIAASVTTKAFDPKTPDDPKEGSATVTFSTDMGNGSHPADVAPLAPTTGQYPWDLTAAEPQRLDGQLTLNPRDQLVTIIAMTRGEEAFEDANHNGLLDPGELFVDQGDPFVDVNDNNAYDGAVAGGLAEVRFCGLNADCSTYHGPNGQWDADTVIWKPTWVVFTGAGAPSTAPAGTAEAPPDFVGAASPPCADYKDAFVASHSSIVTAPIFVYDRWLNTPTAGFTVSVGTSSASALTPTGVGLPSVALETFGSMDFDWVRVSAADNTKQCAIANGAACVERIAFHGFSRGAVGSLRVQNTTTKPTSPASTTGTGCAPGADQFGSTSFQVPVIVNGAHGVITGRTYTGLYAPGIG